jgi:hypothetical protein
LINLVSSSWGVCASSGWTSQFGNLGHLEVHFVLDYFTQGDVRRVEMGDVVYECPARRPAAAS